MTLYEQIKTDRMNAIKAQAASVSILTVLVGEVERLVGKEAITDQKVIALTKKLIDSNNEVAAVSQIGSILHSNSLLENEILQAYIPRQLTDVEIAHIVAINQLETIKDAQAFMKANYAGLYNGKQVSDLFVKGTK